jgi:DNA-binding MarR family transcriptional regulator
MGKSQLSSLIKGMIGKALIEIAPDSKDVRATMISVTSKGHILRERILREVSRRSAEYKRLLGLS